MVAAFIWEVNRAFAPGATKIGRFSINTDKSRFRGQMALLEDFGLACYDRSTALIVLRRHNEQLETRETALARETKHRRLIYSFNGRTF
jgi:hypothetical protein